MFTRAFSRRPQPSTPSAAPCFAVQRFIQPRLTAGPVGDPSQRERSAADEGLEEQEAEAFGLERVKHAFVPTLPPGAPGVPQENVPPPPVPRYGALGSRILRQELARQPVPRIGPPGLPPLIQTKLAIGRAGDSGQRQSLREPSDEVMRSAAAEGVRTPAGTLPFLDRIQASFGRHPVSHVKAHVGPEAGKASRAMNALAFASGHHVVFGGMPDLRTAAHEAAHVLQQQAGVQLAGGIGREGDAYERHADAVADALVAGRSAEGLLGRLLPASPMPVELATKVKAESGGERDLLEEGYFQRRALAAAAQMKRTLGAGEAPDVGGGALSKIALQRKIAVPSRQIEFVDAEAAFHGLRSTFSDVDGQKLYTVLAQFCAEDRKYYNLPSLFQEIRTALSSGAYKIGEYGMDDIMSANDLVTFIKAQDRFQILMKDMEGLQSAGFEYEFASFTRSIDENYTEEEIIPSHQLMGKSLNLGDFFKLSWQLESDAYNTLELVTPPFVFPKNESGNARRKDIDKEISATLPKITDQARVTPLPLPRAADELEAAGLGFGWRIEGAYQEFCMIKKKKGGSAVYGQENVSLYPSEIGAYIEEKFSAFLPGAYSGTTPENLARKVRTKMVEELRTKLKVEPAKESTEKMPEEIPTPVAHAIAVFSRYASNALAIPSMRYRQEFKSRKDTMPTEIKETLGIWVKTDALNLLKDLLADPTNAEIFSLGLEKASVAIMELFETEGRAMINQQQLEGERKLKTVLADNFPLKNYFALKDADDKMAAIARARKAQTEAMEDEKNKLGAESKKRIRVMEESVRIMLDDVYALIRRALAVERHQKSAPKSTTKDFLLEQYGTGEGVRKGTYLKDVPTSKGSMYVTEIR